jgi:hypothetical protein
MSKAPYRTADNPDAYLICLSGHPITSHYHDKPENRREYCAKCGEETIHTCLTCKAEIPGGHFYYFSPGPTRGGRGGRFVPTKEGPVPEHCEECGSPFPWTERRNQARTAAAIAPRPNALESLAWICQNFHRLAVQLRKRRKGRAPLLMEDEYDVQYLIGALLPLAFNDVRPEEWAPSYAGGSTRMDFLIKGTGLVLEAKMTRPTLSASDLRDQLIVDAACYRQHPECSTLVCLVYDPGDLIPNPQALMNDLSGQKDGLDVRVWVVPTRH